MTQPNTPTKPVSKRDYSTARNRLKSIEVQRLSEPGFYHDGGGLYLQISPAGTKSWVFRYRLHGRVRDMGLGSFLDFTLAEARKRATEQRQLVTDKIDPIGQREARSVAAKAVLAQQITFEECAKKYHLRESVHWKNAKHAAQWINTLRDYAFPKFGSRMVHTVSKKDILDVLTPIWTTKPETASRVRQRIKAVLDWAAAKDHYPNYPHGIWDQISQALGKNRRKDREHHAACPFKEVGKVIQKARNCESTDIVKLAFEFTILTAARSGETRGARWREINWEDKLWVIPAKRMKAAKEHRVPLSDRCLEILEQAKAFTGDAQLVFCHPRTGKEFSDAVFTSMMHKRMGLSYTMHGFRSSFRDWGGEIGNHQRELLEVSLAHLPGDQTEHAYWRGDMITKRMALMQDWANYLLSNISLGADTASGCTAFHSAYNLQARL